MRPRPEPDPAASMGGERGSSLLEVLIALFIMLVLTLGILQMFSMAYMMNMGSAARTQLTFKCEQVTEVLRFAGGLIREGGTVPAGSNIVFTTGDYLLPYEGSEADYAFWGPGGSNVVEAPREPYRLSYNIVDDGNFWLLTVVAVPADPAVDAGARRYIGAGITGKRVTYVSRIPK